MEKRRDQVAMDQVAMDQTAMESLVKAMSTEYEGENGYVAFMYNDLPMYLISDVSHNRMRIIAPITEYGNLSSEQIDSILTANFHVALDARYAVSDGMLYSAYIHPMAELTERQIEDAVEQVANLAANFGQSYSSGALIYGGPGADDRVNGSDEDSGKKKTRH